MDVIFKRITEKEFSGLNAPLIFDDQNTDRVFGEIFYGSRAYKLAWQSDLIDPEFYEIKNDVFSVGIDQKFTIINLQSYNKFLELDLTYNYISTIKQDEYIYAISELEIFKIDCATYKVLHTFDLPDFFESVKINVGYLEITYMGGEEKLIIQ